MIRPTPALVLACYAAAFGAPAPVPDLDRDGIVGHGDLAAVTAAFFVSADGDLTGDGATDDDDLAVVLAAWGQRFIYTAPPHVYGAEPTITIPLACLVRVTDRGWFVRLDAADGSVAEAHGSAEWWALRLDAWGWRGEYVLSAQTMHALGLPTTPYGPEITTFVLDTGAGGRAVNTIEYTIEGSTFSLSYQELRDKYVELVGLSDADFFDRIHEALHLACIVSWFKGRGQWAVSDIGAVHEIAHYLHIPGDTVLADVRAAFNRDCELA